MCGGLASSFGKLRHLGLKSAPRRTTLALSQFVNITTGTVIAFDRGLIDYILMGLWTATGVYFVTRLKHNADYQVLETRELPKHRNIVKDQIIRLKDFYSIDKCPYDLRIIEVAINDGVSRPLLAPR